MSGRKKLVLVVIDGLSPAALERALDAGQAPALAYLVGHGRRAQAVSVFPSLTPVCLSSIATGGGPDVHHIPHLVWYDRSERRRVEYGSSFGAIRAAGTRRSLRDAILHMNSRHLAADAVTVFEALEDAGLSTAAVNMTCYRGRTAHAAVVPGLGAPAFGPKRFFYFGLFESDPIGAPLAVAGRHRGSSDAYAAAAGRWLVTRDGFDFLLLYLPDYDFASHALGPEGAGAALSRSDAAIATVLEAAGGPDEFLERYAVIVCSDHAQTAVEDVVRLESAFGDLALHRPGLSGPAEIMVTASNRAAMVYRLDGCSEEPRALAERLDGLEGVEVALFAEDGSAVARRGKEELRFRRTRIGWDSSGDPGVLQGPNALERAWSALQNPNAGEVIVAAAPGSEFADLSGRHHLGGGSHGSLAEGDSFVPVVTVGVDRAIESITDVAPAVLAHFGVEAPAYVRAARAA